MLTNHSFLQSQEVEETLKRIASHKGVVGTIVVNNEGKSATAHRIAFGDLIVRVKMAFSLINLTLSRRYSSQEYAGQLNHRTIRWFDEPAGR